MSKHNRPPSLTQATPPVVEKVEAPQTWYRLEQKGRGVKLFALTTIGDTVVERKQVGPENLPGIVLEAAMVELEKSLFGRDGK